jgi:ferrochelatase
MTGVLLVNMGGPESPEELKQFLRLMFLDKHIIPAPWLIRNFLSLYISNNRYKKSWERYKLIGGTPLKKDTQGMAILLQKSLGNDFVVKPAYSYSEPFITKALNQFLEEKVNRVIVVPLYPQASITTTQSVKADIEKVRNLPVKINVIHEFYRNQKFISFWSEAILQHIKTNNLKNPILIFSAHSIPKSFIKKGDTYKKGIEESAKLISDLALLEYHVSYQSGMNPKTWLGPDTVDTIEHLIENAKDEIIIVPISFIGENLETLYDLDQVIVPQFKNSNVHVSRVRIPENSPIFIEMLKEFVYEYNH